MPFNNSAAANLRLTGPTDALTPTDVRDLMPWLGSLGGPQILRLQAELAIQQLQAIQEFDRTSRRLTKYLIGLTVVIAIFTVVVAYEPMRQIWHWVRTLIGHI